MSAIALKWVASIKVGNQTAKQLLQFYACHNFGKPGFEFKNKTLADQLEVSERAIQLAHKLLLEKNLIIKETRFDEHGRQLSNHMYLNIPDEFVDNFFGEGERSSSLGVNVVQGEGERSSSPSIYNNNNNNKNNISCAIKRIAQSRFNEFWSLYPRKKDKKRSKKIWEKKNYDEIASLILKDIENRKLNEQQWKNILFIPHPSTYLNNELWQDDIDSQSLSNEKKSGMELAYERGMKAMERLNAKVN